MHWPSGGCPLCWMASRSLIQLTNVLADQPSHDVCQERYLTTNSAVANRRTNPTRAHAAFSRAPSLPWQRGLAKTTSKPKPRPMPRAIPSPRLSNITPYATPKRRRWPIGIRWLGPSCRNHLDWFVHHLMAVLSCHPPCVAPSHDPVSIGKRRGHTLLYTYCSTLLGYLFCRDRKP